MTATPQRIRQITRESVVVTASDAGVLALHQKAQPTGAIEPFESFYDAEADAQAVLDERFGTAKLKQRFAAVETDEDLDIGGAVALSPDLPTFRAVDPTSEIDIVARLKGYAIDGTNDTFAIEIMGD